MASNKSKKNRGPGKRALKRLKRSQDDFFSLKKKGEFKFYGLTVEEVKKLSLEEYSLLVPTRTRRSIKRGFDHKKNKLLTKISRTSLPDEDGRQKPIKTHCRDMPILPEMLGYVISIHNGKEYKPVTVRPEMLGHFLGEFSLTRKVISHGSPGIGASKSSLAVATRK